MIILASGSPRRIELLASLGLEFLVRPAAVDETIDPATPPDEAVAELSRRKASHVYRTAASPDDTVIAADTLVWQDGRLLGKPADAADAEYRDARIAEPPHAVLAEDERCSCKSLVHDETIFLTANDPIRILHKFR